MVSVEEVFSTTGPEFCSCCGSILPVVTGTMLDNECYVCQTPTEAKELQEISYVIHFNDPDVYSKERGSSGLHKGKGKQEMEAEGPLVDRDCKECGHKQMSYATLQLRSVDEGQTVFYTCPKCKFKESENS
ncbi:unnamed protein product [Orchesella dallaii]|uniref:DNA-directed RNA polymerase subunit n=1 Tax=Orchesella dallaii TaxID=48710 RepID=A0ABP1Q2Q0_9HEXA